MLVRARVAILLCEAEINDVNHVLALAQADQEAATGRRVRSESEFRGAGDGGARAGARSGSLLVGFDVAMDEALRVHVL